MKGSTLLHYAGSPEKETLTPPQPPISKAMEVRGHAQFSFILSHDLIKFRALLQQEAILTSKQTTLDMFFIQ